MSKLSPGINDTVSFYFTFSPRNDIYMCAKNYFYLYLTHSEMIVFLWLFRLMSHFSGELFFDPQGKLANFQIFGDFLDIFF